MEDRKDDFYFMNLANLEGQKALSRGDYPAGCVVVKQGRVIAKSGSLGITKNDSTAHAELIAISKSCRKLKSRFLESCTIYSNIEPCLMCAKAIVYSGAKKVVYGTEHKEYGTRKTFDILRKNGIGKDLEILSGVQKEKSSKLLKQFLEKSSKPK
ncbi:MAG: nucleoside deaminase [Candidatus Aenigmarchaeota archaeon]|nr:nucleoside deaminase [Candidatus Aenigmarchaeota archaeon]